MHQYVNHLFTHSHAARNRWRGKQKMGETEPARTEIESTPSHSPQPHTLVLARLEQLWQREPLPRHLVPVVCVYELVVVDAVCCVALHAFDGRLAAVERDDIVHEALAGRGERDAAGGVGCVIV
jgi:hypothetical protein